MSRTATRTTNTTARPTTKQASAPLRLVAGADSESPATVTPKKPTEQIDLRSRAMHTAYGDLTRGLIGAGVMQSWSLIEAEQTPIGRLWLALDGAQYKLESYCSSRISRLERSLRAALATDALTDAQREAILKGLYGTDGARRSANVLTEPEAAMIAQYRAMTRQEDRTLIRTLCARLSEAGVRDEGNDAAQSAVPAAQ